MKEVTSANTARGVGVLAAIAASLCCITPVLALLAGASGAASSLSWIEPVRPYLIGLAIAALGFAWYRSLTAKEVTACGPDGSCVVEKRRFIASRNFLTLITVTAFALIAFPYYATVFYPKAEKQNVVVVESNNIQSASFQIKGMTCGSCEEHAEIALDEWITMRIVVRDQQAKLYLNSNVQPSLIVNDLKLGPKASGTVGLWVDIGTEGYFTDLRIRQDINQAG